MINEISSIKSAIVSVTSAFAGTTLNFVNDSILLQNITIDNILQRGAWMVAIIAGIIAIVNGVRKWFKKGKDESKQD